VRLCFNSWRHRNISFLSASGATALPEQQQRREQRDERPERRAIQAHNRPQPVRGASSLLCRPLAWLRGGRRACAWRRPYPPRRCGWVPLSKSNAHPSTPPSHAHLRGARTQPLVFRPHAPRPTRHATPRHAAPHLVLVCWRLGV
jgi:hypothetical protein